MFPKVRLIRQPADGAIDAYNIQGFSHIFLIFDAFLDWILIENTLDKKILYF
jgi:hypothetical protein